MNTAEAMTLLLALLMSGAVSVFGFLVGWYARGRTKIIVETTDKDGTIVARNEEV